MTNTTSYEGEDRDRDFRFFIDNYNDLFQTYGKSFIAIRDKRVLGGYPDVQSAVDDLFLEYPPGSYILQECTGSADAYIRRVAGVSIGE